MAFESTKSIALLPIQPRFATLIMDGKKKVEFRKRRFRNEVSYAVLYATNPIKKILAYFEVSYIDEDSPKELWARYNKVGGIMYEEFKAYYSSSTIGVAIGVGKVCALRSPIPLSNLARSFAAPQGFIYLAPSDLEKIRNYR